MNKILVVVFMIISANLFAQEKNEFFVKNNGDTVYCDIKEVSYEPESGLIGMKKVKNNLTYKVSNQEKNVISLNEILGFKLKKQVFLWKKIVLTENNDENRHTDTTYEFFPNEIGSYIYDRIVLVKNNVRFYRKVVATGSGQYSSYVYKFFVEKGNNNVLYALPVADNFMYKNKPETWLINR